MLRPHARPPLVLASASPRRLALLAQLGIVPDRVMVPAVDETPSPDVLPAAHASALARAKAMAVAAQLDAPALVLAADTVVAAGRRILDKTEDPATARAILRLLAGRRHRVITAVALWDGAKLRERVVTTRVAFRNLSDAEIEDYIASQEWRGKAGAYAIQGLAGAFVPWLNGSYSAVVGLPLAETTGLLRGAGWLR